MRLELDNKVDGHNLYTLQGKKELGTFVVAVQHVILNDEVTTFQLVPLRIYRYK